MGNNFFKYSKVILLKNILFLLIILSGVIDAKSQGSIGFNCTPSQTSVQRCEGFSDFPEIKSCEIPDCGTEEIQYCWYVKKNNANYIIIPDSNRAELVTNAGNFSGPGDYKFRRAFACGTASCPGPNQLNNNNSSNEVQVVIAGNPIITGCPSNPNVCVDNTLVMNCSPAGGTYNIIAGPGTGSINGSILTVTGAGVMTIQYTVIVGGCSSSENFQVTGIAKPTISGCPTNSNVCVDNNLTMNCSPVGGTYAIIGGPGTGTINGNILTVTGPGIITVQYTISVNGCTTNQNFQINGIAKPIITGCPSNPNICVGNTLTMNCSPAGGTYNIISGPGMITGTGLTATGPGSITIQYSVTVNGCSSSVTFQVNGIPLPVISGCPANPSVCIGNNLSLNCNPAGGNYSVISGPGNITGNTLNVTGVGTLMVRYTVTSNNCSSNVTFQVTCVPLPDASISGPTSICEGSPEFLTASGGTSYVWSDGTTGNTVALSELADGDSTFHVTVTDIFGCRNIASHAVEVRNVPDIEIDILNTSNDNELIIKPKIINPGNLFPENTTYRLFRNGNLAFQNQRNGIEEFKAEGLLLGSTYLIVVEVLYSNNCIIKDSVYRTINSLDCKNFNPRINNVSIGNEAFLINICDSSLYEFNITFSGVQNSRIKISTIDTIFTQTNNVVSGLLKINLKKDTINDFILDVEHTYGEGGALKAKCTYIIKINNLPLPTLSLQKDSFCFENNKDIRLISNVDEISVALGSTSFFTQKDSFGFIHQIILNDTSNYNRPYQLLVNNLKYKNNNVCPAYNDTLNYTILRTPQIDLITDLCKDDSVKNLLIIDNKDLNADFIIRRDAEILKEQLSGIQLDTSSSLFVYAELKHGNYTCKNESTGTINVNELPEAIIDQYPEGCGPFYQIVNYKTQPNAHFRWKGSNDSNILKITEGPDVIVYAGNLPLILEAEENGCYHRDIVTEPNTTDFSLALQDDVIEGRVCGSDTLYFNSTFSDDINCFRWYYVNQDGAIVDVSEDENEKPWFKGRNNITPVLVKSTSCDLCKGVIVSRTSEIKTDDCMETGVDKTNDPWKIYPVPVIDFITISSGYFKKGRYEFLLADAIGHVVDKITIDHAGGILRHDVHVSGYPEGLYFIKHQENIKKFVIIK